MTNRGGGSFSIAGRLGSYWVQCFLYCHNISFETVRGKKGSGTIINIQQQRTLDNRPFNDQKMLVFEIFTAMSVEANKMLRKSLKI